MRKSYIAIFFYGFPLQADNISDNGKKIKATTLKLLNFNLPLLLLIVLDKVTRLVIAFFIVIGLILNTKRR